MKDAEMIQYKKMTQTPVSHLIMQLAAPTVISMMVTNIYNTADTWFVSQIGTSAAGAVSIVFALMAWYQAIGFMFGHGAGSNISRKLGAKEEEKVKVYASTSFFYSFLCSILISLFGLLLMDPLLRFLGSTETILPYARQYIFWILVSGPFLSASCVLNNILRYEGQASLAMIGLTAGGILNIIGDPIFMFVFHLGVFGAGLSTAVSQLASFFILLSMYKKDIVVSEFHIKSISKSRRIILPIVTVGLPSLMRQGLNSLATILLNHQASFYGDSAIAAMGIVAKVAMFVMAIAIGIGQGFQPVSAFNFGAQKYDRVRKGFRFTVSFSTILLMISALICFLFSKAIMTWFRNDPEVITVGQVALRWQCLSFLFASYSVGAGMLFQSTGISGRATFISVLRTGVVFIPLILYLPGKLGLFGVEIAQPLADMIASLISIPITEHFLKQLHQGQSNKTSL